MIIHILFIHGALEFLQRKLPGILGPRLFSVMKADALPCPSLCFLYLCFLYHCIEWGGWGERLSEGKKAWKPRGRVMSPGLGSPGAVVGQAVVSYSWHGPGADTPWRRGLGV